MGFVIPMALINASIFSYGLRYNVWPSILLSLTSLDMLLLKYVVVNL
jgi:hypothetical protein